jgi:diguanylate cyclase (GGDEF)-like protein
VNDSGASAEEAASEATRRLWIRRASMIIVVSQGLALFVGALLPTTASVDRWGLLFGAGLVAASGLLWFLVLPRGLFGAWRIFVASTIAQLVMLVPLATTGGLGSVYFPYYLLPSLVMTMAGSGEQTLALGAVASAGLIGLGLSEQSGAVDNAVRDLFAVRLLEVVTFTLAAAAASQALGAIRTALSAQTQALADQARRDPLTGLRNRKALMEDLPRLLAGAERRASPLSVVALDVDGLKAVNDLHGHAAGDRLLSRFSVVLGDCLRGQDLAVRPGSDEFVLLLPDTDAAGARRLVERIQAAAAVGGASIRFSAGIATSTAGASADWLLALADDALYTEKAAWGGREYISRTTANADGTTP